MMGIDHAVNVLALGLWNRQQRVVDAMGSNRPTVVLASLGNVDLVTTARPVLIGPELAAPRIERCALLIAMAKRPDLGANV